MKNSYSTVVFNILGYLFTIIVALMCILPFLLIISASFSSNASVVNFGFSLIPKVFSLEAYKTVFENSAQILNAYKISIIVTVSGTFLLLLLCSMTGYVLSRKDYKYRNVISFYFFFCTIFGGGLVPWYILCVHYLHFKENPLIAMILPGIFGYFYVIIIRTSMASIPDSISESAKIDGANDFTIYTRLILPLSKPVLATVGLLAALGYWNDWFSALLFVNKSQYYPLQYFLYKALISVAPVNRIDPNIRLEDLPTETFKFAETVIVTGPILLIYPFFQKYFIKGITIGAVKG